MKRKLPTTTVLLLMAGTAIATYVICKRNFEKKLLPYIIHTRSIGSGLDSLSVAQTNVKQYKAVFGDTMTQSFTISSLDLMAVTGLNVEMRDTSVSPCKYDHIRVFFGLDASRQMKLYMMPDSGCLATVNSPVNTSAGYDLYFTICQDSTLSASQSGYFVMDVNMPCPSFCNFHSSLRDSNSKNSK